MDWQDKFNVNEWMKLNEEEKTNNLSLTTICPGKVV